MPSVGHRQRASRQPMQSLQAVCTPSVLWQYDERNTFTLIILPCFSEVSFLLPVVPLSMKKTNIQDIANLAYVFESTRHSIGAILISVNMVLSPEKNPFLSQKDTEN